MHRWHISIPALLISTGIIFFLVALRVVLEEYPLTPSIGVNLRDSYARVDRGEVWLLNVHISPYSHTGYAHHEERRDRKLLLHRHEIQKLTGRVVEKGLTLVPLRMYMKKGRVKVALALVKGKQAHDKRETIRRREIDRETRAAVKARSR